MMENNMSLSDIAAVTRNTDGFLEGNGIIILILFFLIFGFGGNGFGMNRGVEGYATPTQVYDATNQQSVFNSLNGIKASVDAGAYENARLIDSVNYNGMQNTNCITNAINNGFNGVGNKLDALSYQMSQCCCDLKTQMLQDKYDDAMNQLNQAQIAISNSVQTNNILSQLGRYYTNPAVNPYTCYNMGNGTTIA